ncbi:MAG: hypothetical protein ACXVP0_13250 [Bacteroidia bacterium]
MSDKRSTFDTIVGAATIISAIFLLSKIFGRSEEEELRDDAHKSRQKEYGKTKPSFADYVYKDFAESLTVALTDGTTEDEKVVYSVFEKMRNISDVLKTIEAFGHQRVLFTAKTISLPEAITELFSQSEKGKLNRILKGKGIDYVFH